MHIPIRGRIKPGEDLNLFLLKGEHPPLQINLLESLHSILRPFIEWEMLLRYIHVEGIGQVPVNDKTFKFYFHGDFTGYRELLNPTLKIVVDLYKEILHGIHPTQR